MMSELEQFLSFKPTLIVPYKIGKFYKIDWDYKFSIYDIEYATSQGFNSTEFVEKYKEAMRKDSINQKFEFLGMSCHSSGHFCKEFAKVRVFGDVILIPHQLLLK